MENNNITNLAEGTADSDPLTGRQLNRFSSTVISVTLLIDMVGLVLERSEVGS